MNTEQSQLIFGIHAVELALKAGDQIQSVWIHKDSKNNRLLKLIERIERSNLVLRPVKANELDRMVDGRHQGVVASIQPVSLKTEKQLKQDVLTWEQPLILVLDCIEDPRNLGACLRSADAAGVTAVIFSKDKSASITAVTHKTAAGAVEHLQIYQVTNLVRAIETLKAAGVWVYGTALDEQSQDIYATDLTGSVAIVMGNEGRGLRQLVQQTCDHLIHIPMLGEVQSLNVSVATGITLFEVVRQRQV